MPTRHRSRPRTFGAVVMGSVAFAVMITGGCAGTVAGTPSVDGSALLSSAFSAALTATATGGSPTTLPKTLSFNLPSPPSPTITSSTTARSTTAVPPSTEGTPTRASGPAASTAAGVNGVDIDKIITQLGANPLVADAAATKAADPTALAALGRQVSSARTAGFAVTVVLIGHEVDNLTAVADQIAQRTRSTSIAVSTSHFAVSSKEFSSAQLNTAEDAASQAGTPVDAAAALVTALMAQRPASTPPAGTSTPTTGKTGRPTTPAAGGDVLDWPRFQLPDGSIACLIDANTVRCDVVSHTYTPPQNPNPDCQGDYGAAVMMTASKAPTFICISDTVADPSLPKLAGGATTQVGNVMCFSNPPSVTCLSLASAHGFSLQPRSYTFY